MQASDIYNNLPPFVASIQRGYFIAAMVATIIVFIANCLIYEDNGAKCWYLIIPFYNLYTKFKIFWNKNYFFFHLIPFIIAFIAIMSAAVVSLSIAFDTMRGNGYAASTQIATSGIIIFAVGISLWLICITIIGILEIILEYHVSTRYNYDGLFTVGLILLPLIFYTILGVKCIKSGVFGRIPTGRKVFMVVCVLLLIALTALPICYHVF